MFAFYVAWFRNYMHLNIVDNVIKDVVFLKMHVLCVVAGCHTCFQIGLG
jgi:hypothetical protein